MSTFNQIQLPVFDRHRDRYDRCIAEGSYALESWLNREAKAIAEFSEKWCAMEAIAPSVMLATLMELGCFPDHESAMSLDDILIASGLRQRVKPLIGQWLDAMTAAGILTQANNIYSCHAIPDITKLRNKINSALETVAMHTPYDAFSDYFVTCVNHQVGLITGETKPANVLFSDKQNKMAEALYSLNPSSRLQNHVVLTLVQSLCNTGKKQRGDEISFSQFDRRTQSTPKDRLVQPYKSAAIIEIGAGIGATSAELVAHLSTQDIRYVFSDISRYFLKRAKCRFSEHSFFEYQQFDIDRDPQLQNLRPGTFDIVIAANVLHTAKDIDRSLKYVRSLLTRTGCLIAVEITMNTPVQMLTFAHFDGLNHYEDLRTAKNLPFLTSAEWQDSFLKAGFSQVSAIPKVNLPTMGHKQQVLFAEA